MSVSDYQRSDGWEALRARLEASSTGSGFRGGWVPRRRGSWTLPPPRGASTSTLGDGPTDDAAGSDATDPAQPSSPHGGTPLNLTRSHLLVGVLVTAVALAATVVVVWSAQPSEQAVPLAAHAAASASPTSTAVPALPAPEETATVLTQPGQRGEVVVHVAGKVRRPGVLRLPGGSRVIDAVEAAGGARRGADLSDVNLARELQDGEQVRIGLPPDPTGVGGGNAGVAGGAGQASPIDLNTAGADVLESLPGIGPVLASRIVSYREQSGRFHSVDQLLEVPGIGPAVLSSLAGLVRV